MPETTASRDAGLSDEQVVGRIIAGERALFETVMRRYNQRVYRVARAILKDDVEAEDAVQQAYIQAYLHLGQFSGQSRFSTWLTRIVIHEALGRLRKRRSEPPMGDDEDLMSQPSSDTPDPERLAYGSELRAMLESAIDTLPDSYRLVFVCREVEGLSTAETADVLEIGDEAVKTRLHRARALLRRELFARAGAASADAFAFERPRCDALVSRVLECLDGTAR